MIQNSKRVCARLLPLCPIIALIVVSDSLAQGNQGPAPQPVGQAIALTTAPVIDGNVLDDPAWAGARPLTEFWQIQPNVGQPASQKTSVYIGFTDTALHIAVVAYDDEPQKIISTDSRRDSSLEDTDSFRVMIDGQMDRQNGYIFGTNPAGIEFDGQIEKEGAGQFVRGGDGGFNLNWDAAWTVKAAISDIGWSAEMEIPFTSLRFGTGEVQEWGINFERRIRRNNEIAFWAPLSQDRTLYRVSEAGSIQGIRVPRQRNLQITPYVLGNAQRGGALSGTETNTEVGFDLKYSITPSLTLDATVNTDFAQVEVDEQQVNLDRFSLFFPEKRPFFLENAGQFTVGTPREVELFFSRRIGIGAAGGQTPIDGGLRLSGKVGGTTNVGLLYMGSEAVSGVASGNEYVVARVNQEFSNRSSLGFLAVSRDGDGSLLGNGNDDENQTYAIDGRLGIGDNALLLAWAAKTSTPGRNGKDDAFAVNGEYDDSDWTLRLGYSEVGGDFNPEVGFLARRDYRKFDTTILRRIRPANSKRIFELRPHISYRGFWDFDGFQETGFLHVDSIIEWKSGIEFRSGVNFTREGVKAPFDIVNGVTIQPGTYDHEELVLEFLGNQSAPLNFSVRSFIGGRFGGDRVTLEPTIRYRIGEKFSSEFSYNYNKFDLPVPGGDFTANLARLRLSYSFTPKMLLQALMQYNDTDDQLSTNLRFSWLKSGNTGLYLVYNEVDERGLGALPRGREFIVKYSHLFDVLN
jgi:hypothetical protein